MIRRTLGTRLAALAHQYPVVFLTGPRQSGKTTLSRLTFPSYYYLSLEDLQTRQEAIDDPRGFLRRLEGAEGAVLDEVQRTPDLFSYIQGFVDERRGGPLVLTGSQQFLLGERISQTLAGRVAILELLPFSLAELAERTALAPESWAAPEVEIPRSPRWSLDEVLFQGFFPRIHDQRLEPTTWLDGYVRTYVERDVRNVAGVGDLEVFTRFVGLCAGRTGQLLNTSSLGADAGVSHVTAKKWVSILQASYVVDLLRPHFNSFSKRLVKSPKLYFLDTGLLCYLLGIRRTEELHRHPLRGAIFENFIVAELRKVFLHHGQRPPLYFWRDSAGHEVDLLIDHAGRPLPVEIKSGITVASDALQGLDYYRSLSGGGGVLVYGGDEWYPRGHHLLRPWWSCS